MMSISLLSLGDSEDRCASPPAVTYDDTTTAAYVSEPLNDLSNYQEPAGYTDHHETVGYTDNQGGHGEVTAYGNNAGYSDYSNNYDQFGRYADHQKGYGDYNGGYNGGYYGRYARYGNNGYNNLGGYGDHNDYGYNGNDQYGHGNNHYGNGNEHFGHGNNQYSHGNEYNGHGNDHYGAVIPKQNPHYNQYPPTHVVDETAYTEPAPVKETAIIKKDYSKY